MPIHDLGYRGWNGDRMARALRPLIVARGGISLVWRRRWLRIILTLGWLPIIVPAFGLFIFEYSSSTPEMQRMAVQVARTTLQRPDLANQIVSDPEAARHEVWSTLILTYFRYPQLFAMVMLIGLIAPMLVSHDLRTKAYLLYFSRPLSPTQYILGKSAVIWFLLAMIATVPALIAYVLGVLLSPDFSVIAQTWDIPFRILAASVVLMVPTTSLAIAFSSFTSESRYATFSWFATWAMGFVSYQVLTSTTAVIAAANAKPGRPIGPRDLVVDFEQWRLLSPYHTLGKVQSWVFGLDRSDTSVVPAILMLTAITVVSFWFVRRRIVARLSV